tara:strand:- start:275 stop:661 length:387 start_codon:yes stop_codon:yes gene_type:complete
MAETVLRHLKNALAAAEAELQEAQATVDRLRKYVANEEGKSNSKPGSNSKRKGFGQTRDGAPPVSNTIEITKQILKDFPQAQTTGFLFSEFRARNGGLDRKLFRTRIDNEARHKRHFKRTRDKKWALL